MEACMKASKFWDFVGSNIFSLSTILLGIIVIVLDQLNIMPDTAVQSAILALLALLATSEIVESRKKLSNIEEGLENINEHLMDVSRGVQVVTFLSSDEAINYLAKRTMNATISIDQASLDHLRTTNQTPARQRFKETRNKTILADRVKYRYVGVLYSKRRLTQAKEYVIDHKLHKFFARFYTKPSSDVPLISFTIFDNKEVFTRYPFEHGEDTGYISIQSPHIAKLFMGYFERIWGSAHKLETDNDYIKIVSMSNKHTNNDSASRD
jgi:hypothetical protein